MNVFVLTTLALSTFSGQAWAGARASHFEKGGKMGVNFWNAANAIDGKPGTAWMVPGESENKGEWIEIDVPQGDVDKISIFPGFGKSAETFTDYPRVKKLRVDVFALDDDQNTQQVGTATVDVADKAELQTFDIPDAKVAAGLFGGKVRLTVLEIYDGEDFPNLAVSELYVNMKEFDAPIQLTGADDKAVDGNVKTVWTAATPPTFTVTSAGFGLASIGFTGAGKDLSRVKTVEITVNGLTQTTVLPDTPTGDAWAAVPGFNGYTGGAPGDIEVKVVDTYPGKKPEIGIAEVKGHATNHESI